jgi:hypothetical protein
MYYLGDMSQIGKWIAKGLGKFKYLPYNVRIMAFFW